MTRANTEANSDRRAHLRLIFLLACISYVLAIAFLPEAVSWSPFVCGSYRVLGLPCPGCGMTRAFACLVRLEPLDAMRFNPLIVVAAPTAIVMTCDSVLECLGRPGLMQRVPAWLSRLTLACFTAGICVVFLIRVVSWAAPTWNPDGLAIPPNAFPPA